jgi:hypothetical protein
VAWMIGSCPAIAQRLLTNATEWRKTMDIKRNGSRPSAKGPEAYFSGTVRVDPMFQVGEPARVSGGHVTFEPRSALRVAQPSTWSNPHRHVRTRREALARRDRDDRDDAYGCHGISERQERRLDGKGLRRAIPQMIFAPQ